MIFGHILTYFFLAITQPFFPISIKFCMNHQETIIHRLCMRNLSYKDNVVILIVSGLTMGVATTRTPNNLKLQNRVIKYKDWTSWNLIKPIKPKPISHLQHSHTPCFEVVLGFRILLICLLWDSQLKCWTVILCNNGDIDRKRNTLTWKNEKIWKILYSHKVLLIWWQYKSL